MDFENVFTEMYTPLKLVELISDIIYKKCNEDWDILSGNTRSDAEELLALNFAIKICANHLLKIRQSAIDESH